MNHRSPIFRALFAGLLVAALTLGAFPAPATAAGEGGATPPLHTTATLSPEQAVRQAWRAAQEAESYRFTTEIEQITHPARAITSFGRADRRDRLYLAGETAQREGSRSLTLRMWTGAGSLADPSSAAELRIEGDRAWVRQGASTWQPLNDYELPSAPAGDPLAFLAGLKNVREISDFGFRISEPGSEDSKSAIRVPQSAIRQYAFDLDGPAFAAHMRDAYEHLLRQRGELPAGVYLDTSGLYRGMTGEGELVLDDQGGPASLTLHMIYPPDASGEQVEATIVTTFHDFAHQPDAPAFPTASAAIAQAAAAARGQLPTLSLALVGAAAALLIVIRRRSPKVYAAIALAVIFSMVVVPLMQNQQIAAFSQRQAERQEKAEQAREEARISEEVAVELAGADWDPYTDPQGINESASGESANDIFPLTIAAANTSIDTDGDGLSDDAEVTIGTQPNDADSDDDGLSDGIEVLRLGADPRQADSDGDSIQDNVEVVGFTYRGQKWYLDPNNPDTNGDGLPDSTECPALVDVTSVPATVNCDTDNDGVPDGFDLDNDGDGINDRTDLSPLAVLDAAGRRANLGSVTPFDQDHPLTLNLSGLTSGKPVMLDVQLRPTQSDHLGYAFNIFDWPSGDQAGQIQRVKDTTFKTTDSSARNTEDPHSDYGDMRLIPMLEIEMPAAVGGSQPFSLTLPSVTVAVRGPVSATLTLARPSDSTTTTRVTPDLTTSSVTMEIWDGPCSAEGVATGTRLVTQALTDNVQATFTNPTHRKLTDLADGRHALQLTAGDATACANIHNIINGPYTDWMIDQAPLAPYGISVQEKDTAGTLVAYAPLNVEPDETGGGIVAFSARMLYWPNGNPNAQAATWSRAQTFRLVWLVQVLTDYCDRAGFTPSVTRDEDADKYADELKAHCLAHRSQDIPQLAQTYRDEAWYVTGISVREDSALDIAVLWEDPATDDNLHVDNKLWQAARGLASVFSTGRDCDDNITTNNPDYDPATQTCHADNKRDIVVAARNNGNLTIYNRLDAAGSVPNGDAQRWGIPKNALRTATYSYPHSDYTAELATTKTRSLLHQNFSAYETPSSVISPTLLFAREETFRGGTLNELGSVAGGVLTMNMNNIASTTLSTLSWAPFRYNANAGPGGDVIGWEPYPMADYWRTLRVDLELGLAALSRNQNLGHSDDYIVGQSVLAADVYLAFYRGVPAVVAQGGLSVWRNPWDANALATVGDAGSDSEIAGGLGLVGGTYGIIADMADDAADAVATAAAGATNAAATQAVAGAVATGAAAGATTKKATFEKVGKGFKGIAGAWKEAFDPSNTFKATGKLGKVGIGLAYAAAGAAVIFTIAAMGQGGSMVEQVSRALTIVGLVFQMKGLLNQVKQVLADFKAGKLVGTAFLAITKGIQSTAGQLAKCFKESLSNSVIIGFVLGAVVTWAAMALTIGLGHISHQQTGATIAKAVADTIIQIVMLAINAIPIIGGLINAIIGLIDSLIAAICAVAPTTEAETDDNPYDDARDWLCGGIQGLVSTFLAFLFYSGTVMVDVNEDGRFRMAGFDAGDLVDPNQGVVVGNAVRPTISFTNTIMTVPLPHSSIGGGYPYHYSDSRLRSSAFDYRFGAGEVDLHEGLERYSMSDEWKYVDEGTEAEWGDAGHTWRRSEPVYITKTVATTSTIPLTEPGINRAIALTLSEGYAIPAQECILGVCGIRTERNTIHYPITNSIVLDIFPAMLAGFRELVTLPSGQKALAWSQTGDSFAGLYDADNDGLPFEIDADDSKWDSDYDGLGDYFEIQIGAALNDRDTDDDGLSDWEEMFRRTEPTKSDSDGDGLLDGEEVFHQDVFDTDNDGNRTEWLGGWEFIYSMNTDHSANRTWVWSPPDERDVDADNISDSLEKVYGFNPRVASDGRVLTVQALASETSGGTTSPTDGYVKPGDTLRYETTMKNELMNRYAQGLLGASFPAGLQSSIAPRSFVLQPQQQQTISGNVTVASTAATGVYSLTQTAGALIVDWAELAKQATLWLPFEDPITADRSGSIPEHVQTCTGACTSTGGRFGNALSLDGASSLKSDKVLPQAEASVSFWLKTTAANGTLVAEDTTSGRRVYLKSGQVCAKTKFSSNNTEEICSGTGVNNGVWRHIVYVIGGTAGKQRLYVDSLLWGLGATTTANVGATGALYIGYDHAAGSGYFTGQIDDLRTYDRVLSASEVSALFNQPILYWKMDSTSSSNGYTFWPDSSPLGTRGYCSGATCPALWQGIGGNAAGFSGSQYIEVGNNTLYLHDGQFTLAGWIWPSSAGASTCIQQAYGYCTLVQPEGILGYHAGEGDAYPTLERTGLKLRFGFGTGATTPYVTTGNVLTLDAWNHVAVSYVDGIARIYVNGLLVKEDSGTFVSNSVPYKPPLGGSLWVGRASNLATLHVRGAHVDSEGDPGAGELCMKFGSNIILKQQVSGGEGYSINSDQGVRENGTLTLWEDDGGDYCGAGPDDSDDNIASFSWNTTQTSTKQDPGYTRNAESKSYSGEVSGTVTYIYDNDSVPFHGSIDELSIYNRALDGDTIGEMYRNTAVLLHLRLDEPPGETAFQDAASDRRAACTGGACPTSGLPGRVDQSASFGGNDVLTLPNSAVNQLTHGFSVAAWVKPATVTGVQRVIASSREKSANGWAFGLDGDGLRLTTMQVKDYRLTGLGIPAASWTHIAAVFDEVDDVTFYVNGVNRGKVEYNRAATPDTDDVLMIGATTSAGAATLAEQFTGQLDDVRVIGRSLSAADILTVYRSAPVLQLAFDEARGATQFADSSPNGLTASCSGGCPATGDGILGRQRGAAEFDAYDDNRAEAASAVTVYVDNRSPTVALNQAANSLINATLPPTLSNTWVVHLSGTASDPTLSDGAAGSGIPADGVRVTLMGEGDATAGLGTQTANISGGTWSLDYVMNESDPSGSYTVRVEAQDNVARLTGLAPDQVTQHTARLERSITVDGLASFVGYNTASSSSDFITDSTTLSGDATERPVDLALNWVAPAGAGDQVGITITCNSIELYKILPGIYPSLGGEYGWHGTTHQGATCQVAVVGGAGGAAKVCGEQVATWAAGSGGTTFTADAPACGGSTVAAAAGGPAAIDGSVSGIAGADVGFTLAMPGSPFYQDPAAGSELLHLNFEDAPAANSSITFRDVTGQDHNGTCSSSATCPRSVQGPDTGQGVLFDGSNDTVSVTYKDDLNVGTGPFTLALWMRFDGSSGWRPLFEWGPAARTLG